MQELGDDSVIFYLIYLVE